MCTCQSRDVPSQAEEGRRCSGRWSSHTHVLKDGKQVPGSGRQHPRRRCPLSPGGLAGIIALRGQALRRPELGAEEVNSSLRQEIDARAEVPASDEQVKGALL